MDSNERKGNDQMTQMTTAEMEEAERLLAERFAEMGKPSNRHAWWDQVANASISGDSVAMQRLCQ